MPRKGPPRHAPKAYLASASTCRAMAITPLSCATIFSPPPTNSLSPSRPRDTNNSVLDSNSSPAATEVSRAPFRFIARIDVAGQYADNLIHFLQRLAKALPI